MIVSRDYWSENLRKFAENKHNYMVLETSHIGYKEDEDRLEHAVYVLDYCNMIKWFNDFFAKMNMNRRFNDVIMFDVLKALYTGKSLTEKELQDYFKLLQDFTDLEGKIKKLNSHMEVINIPSEVEFLLLGLSEEEQQDLGRKAIDELNSSYVPELVEMLNKNITVKAFIDKAKELIKDAKKWNKAA